MANYEMKKEDTITVTWASPEKGALGHEIKNNIVVSYDELLVLLRRGKKAASLKPRRTSPGIKMSRYTSLVENALKKGVWATGAAIDRVTVFNDFLDKLQDITPEDLSSFTENAKRALNDLMSGDLLSQDDKATLLSVVENIRSRASNQSA